MLSFHNYKLSNHFKFDFVKSSNCKSFILITCLFYIYAHHYNRKRHINYSYWIYKSSYQSSINLFYNNNLFRNTTKLYNRHLPKNLVCTKILCTVLVFNFREKLLLWYIKAVITDNTLRKTSK